MFRIWAVRDFVFVGRIVLKKRKAPGQLEAGQPLVEAELPRLNTATIDTFVLARGAWLFKPPAASSRYMYEPRPGSHSHRLRGYLLSDVTETP